ncbi:MAG TPA: hypothetical protein VNL74_11770 [Methylococcus sp.]|nr:hypothetical protein [Methylococcus sp.]
MYQTESTFEFTPETTHFEEEQFEFGQSEWAGASGEVFSEGELMELTAELLEITNEEELNHFLGNLVRRAAGAIGKVVRSPVGQAIGGVLKAAAKKALPIAGGALGAYFGGPLGAKIGSGLAQAAGSALGLEAEALSQEDRQFEGGKQFVRFAGETVKNALTSPVSPDPRITAQNAAVQAARVLAPGLLGAAHAPSAMRATSGAMGGRWVRRGRHIVVLNV